MLHHIDCDLGIHTFRFYPRQSHVHGFGDEAPSTWDGVYKTYMSFALLYHEEKVFENDTDAKAPYQVYSEYADEGEGLFTLNSILKAYIDDGKSDTAFIIPFGMGTEWIIAKRTDTFILTMYRNYGPSKAYTLWLSMEDMKRLNQVLEVFLEYMLQHSEGI